MSKYVQKNVPGANAQRALSVVALLGLFACGLMIGFGCSRNNHADADNGEVMQMSKMACQNVAARMSDRYTDAEELAQLNKIYADNCAGRVFETPKAPVAEPQPKEETQQQETCVVIEQAVLEMLPAAESHADSRIERAKIFANLSERGCPENSARYVEMAKQELAVARALQDDEFNEGDTIEVVETYKRLNMQAAAEEIFETAKKLTNPAIDFILQVEKIINEQ